MILDFTTFYAHKKERDKQIRHIGDLRHKKEIKRIHGVVAKKILVFVSQKE